MPWTLYRSDDAGAPVLTGQAGSLVALLDAVLVNGYGSKSPAGWTKAFTGTNKAAFRMGAGRLQGYVRIVDDASSAAGAKEAMISLYESMSGVDSGTDTVIGATGNDFPIRKSDTADGVVRPWLCVADARTFILCLCANSASLSVSVSTTYVGEFFSFVPNDNFNFCIIARSGKNSVLYNSTVERMVICSQGTSTNSAAGHYLARDAAGIFKQINFAKIAPFAGNSGSMGGHYNFPNPADGGCVLAPLYIRENSPADTYTLRGRLRGIYASGHTTAAMVGTFGLQPGETFSGTGDWAGKTFLCPLNCGEAAAGYFVLEVSNTVPTN
jgi:hypothetical protein